MIQPEIDRWASAMRALRPDWRADSLRTFASTHLADRPYRDALVAGVWVASDATAKTPYLLTTDGPWWAACQPPPAAVPSQPLIVTYCAHGEPGTRCGECFPRRHVGQPMSEATRQAIREAVAEGRAELQARRLDKEPTP